MSISPDDLVTQGRRDLVCGDITKAVENFQKACEILASEFGDFDEKLAVPNLLYGTALLELSRMESTVIGNALDGIPESESDDSSTDGELIEEGPELTNEEKEDLSNQVIDAMCEAEPPKESTDPTTSVEGDKATSNENSDSVQDPSTDQVEEEEQDGGAKSAESGDEGGEDDDGDDQASGSEEQEGAGGDEANKSDDEDVSNLQIAWEVIEVAKKIFSRSDDSYNKLKVAECYEKLGEISREKEDYDQAISDLKECLAIRSSILNNDDRDIAEAHFQLGTTYAVSGDLDSASQSFRTSADCLVQYVKNVKAKLAVESDENEETKLLRASLAEVEELIPEIQRRCADVEEDRMAEKMNPSCSSIQAAELPSDSSKPASDISHLVRKKRPAAHESNGTNGTDTNSASNGDEQISSLTKKPKLAQSDDLISEAVPNGLEKSNVGSQEPVVTNGN